MDREMDPRIQRSRRMLIDAIIELVSTGRLEDLTVRDIVDHAKLNRSTFYLHFRDKQDLLDQAIAEILSDLKNAYQSPAHHTHDLAMKDFAVLLKPLDATTGLFEQAARRNIKYQTEMGGKNAAVVLADANLDIAVPAILSGAFTSAGQKCTATSRVIVETSIYDEFKTALQSAVKKLYVGSALDEKSYLGPVASAAQFDKVSSFVSLASREANHVAQADLQVDVASGHYIAPLVVDGVDVHHKLVQDEIFGPVMSLLPVQDFDEAVAACNQTVYGLSASVFTANLNNSLRFLDEAEAGMVRVNLETAGVEYQAPFGGIKLSSSHTREQGQAALDFYSQTKICAVYYG